MLFESLRFSKKKRNFFSITTSLANLVVIATPDPGPAVIRNNANPVILSLIDVLVEPLMVGESIVFRNFSLLLELLYFF